MHQEIEFVSIGAVNKAHGIKGELQITPITDEPEQFSTLNSCYLNFNEKRKICSIEKVRFTRNKILLKLEGIDDRTTAQKLRGAFVEIKLTDLRELSDNEYFIFDLVGLKVKKMSGEFIGELIDVLTLPANDVYVVNNGEQEFLIPAIKDVIKQVDLKRGEMSIDPVDGLFE